MQRKSTYTSIIVLAISLCALLPATSQAQHRRQHHVEEPDTTPLFRGVALSIDIVGPAQRVLGDYGQYEAALRINLKDRYFPILEAGVGSADHQDDVTGIAYKTRAPYGRIGIDFNLLRDKHDIYRLYAGGRYAFTAFKYDLQSPGIADPVYGGQATWAGTDIDCRYHWLEAVAGVDAKIAGPLHLGWSVRYRARLAQKYGDIGEPWYVPGFGKSGGTRIGATFNVTFEL